MDHQLVGGATQTVQDPLLHVDDVLRIGVVEDDAHEEGAPEGQSTRLRIGRVTGARNDRFDLFAGFGRDERRLVEYPRHRFLRHRGEAGNVVDRRTIGQGAEVLAFCCARRPCPPESCLFCAEPSPLPRTFCLYSHTFSSRGAFRPARPGELTPVSIKLYCCEAALVRTTAETSCQTSSKADPPRSGFSASLAPSSRHAKGRCRLRTIQARCHPIWRPAMRCRKQRSGSGRIASSAGKSAGYPRRSRRRWAPPVLPARSFCKVLPGLQVLSLGLSAWPLSQAALPPSRLS